MRTLDGERTLVRIFIERVYALMARFPRSLLVGVARFGHRIMEARHLRGIQRRAERSVSLANLPVGPRLRRATAFLGRTTYFGATDDEARRRLYPGMTSSRRRCSRRRTHSPSMRRLKRSGLG